MASYDELLAYAQSKGGRLPTEAELRIWLDRYSSSDAREGANVGVRNWVPIECVSLFSFSFMIERD
jgi:formylglycine-generating enzyme required for sulfatase activity